ncbi:unnamed protein product [Rhizophagus irregularis]|nr:unnamed protein product [Rhizophagus irregularis]
MSKFFSKLSQNLTELLDDNEYYDIIIEVGEEPNIKSFRAHMNILCYRSPYIKEILSSNKKKSNNSLSHIKLSNISPENFHKILIYIYGGIFSLNEQSTSDNLKILAAADQLYLQELVDYLQKYFIENKIEWMEQHFELTHRISFQSNKLFKLQQFFSLIKRDDLQMKEIEVWDHVLKWGLERNQTLISDPDTWTDNDFKAMKSTLQHCIPIIRFHSLSSNEFSQKIRPYKNLFKERHYEELLNSYLDSDNNPNDNIPFPRNLKIDRIIDSKIISLNIISTISRWIDKIDFNSNFSYLRELYLPYKFKLLLRGSQNGFTSKKFHELCDNKPNTVTFIKVKGIEEILGGYNPLIWQSSNIWGQTKYSFIFSFKSKNNLLKNAILSNVKEMIYAINYHPNAGPYFGSDLIIHSSDSPYGDFNVSWCRQKYYEKKIRDTEAKFTVEDYEVFQIL